MTTEQPPPEPPSRNWTSYPRPAMYAGRTGDFRSLDEIAPVFRHVFSEFPRFNEIQSLVMDDLLYTDKSLVVSAPTGSGKTAIFELAMIRLLMKLEDAKYIGDFKVIYIAPIKALCAEKFNQWREKFDRLGVKSAEVTGDTEFRDFWDLPDCNLILTTPEKWNSITRRWRQNVGFVRLVKLVMIDEVHILNDPFRGPILEAVVSRMRSIHRFIDTGCGEQQPVEPMRIIALSATVPNVADLAAWVGEKNTTCFYNISESRRPIKIDKHVLGFYCDPNTTSYRFDMNLNYKLFDIIRKHSSGRPTLVFCSTRKATEMAAKHLTDNHALGLSEEQRNNLQTIAERVQNVELKRRLAAGYAYHHAGLSFADRNMIEDSFRSGQIPVLCCTSALAMGVNLPAHLVIIKSTQMYTDYGMDEYPESSIFQMIGRAGRPQYDTFGVAVIMTQREKVRKYERLTTGSVPIESYLHEHLAEHLNSEIVLQTITDMRSAMDWIRSTFLYVRALAAPARYGLGEAGRDKAQIEKKLEDLCRTELSALVKYSLAAIAKDQGADDDDGMWIKSTLYGRLMAQYCLNFRTVKLLRKIKGTEPLLEVFTILTHCDEFSAFKCRNSDKRTLNELNRSQGTAVCIRFPLRGRIQTTPAMVSVLLQAVLGNLTIDHNSLQQEAARMIAVGKRLVKYMADFVSVGCSRPDGESGVYLALLNTLILGQCLESKLWENSPFLTKQLRGIGTVYASQLAARGKISFQEVVNTDPRELEVILKKAPPFGNDIVDFVRKLPNLSIQLVLKEDYMMEVTVVQNNAVHDKQISVKLAILVGDTNNNVLYFNDNCDSSFGGNGSFSVSFKILDATVATVTGHVICANWVGLDCSQTVVINEEAAAAADKQKSRKSNNQPSKKITEFYHKEITETTENEVVDEIIDLSAWNETFNSIPTIELDSSPRRGTLESFQFTRKPKMIPSNNVSIVNETITEIINNSVVQVEPYDVQVDIENIPPVDSIMEVEAKRQRIDYMKTDDFSCKPTLAPCIPPVPARYSTTNRQEYFKEMHRKNPFLLFGRPEDYQARLQNPVRRVCIFGVFTEIPRVKRNDTAESVNGRRDEPAEVLRTVNRRSDGDNGIIGRTNYFPERPCRKELDLGIADFLASPPKKQKQNFFR
ncbi:probable ATP-dependent DNA helicase HFM1 [Topomyia yanbarensis]|uniref:probable ATP-dependent DNA helicase HFM1 n=1 Tax=Topomyia yanbarensis TaxID=2498891 RepID=UPI00273C64F2|nr:probable ATP-dependent DNA helicase HFM1 [Topomyia yanbarensis]